MEAASLNNSVHLRKLISIYSSTSSGNEYTKIFDWWSWKQNLFTLTEALQSDILIHFFWVSFLPYPKSTLLVLKIQQFKNLKDITVPCPGSVTLLYMRTIYNLINNLLTKSKLRLKLYSHKLDGMNKFRRE